MTFETNTPGTAKKARWLATGGILATLGASSCCILPLVLFSLGVSGAWVGNLTTLSAPLWAATQTISLTMPGIESVKAGYESTVVEAAH